MEFSRKFLQYFPESSMFVRLTCIQIIAAYRFRQGFPGTITSIPCISSKCNPFRVTWSKSMITWSFENLILDSYSAPMTKNSERFQPFKLDVCWIPEIELLRFRGWNGILEFESRRNKSSTYFSFRTGKYFASQEAPFLLSRIKNAFMISIQMQKIGFQEIIFRSVHERMANSSQQGRGCVHQTNH